MKRSEVNAILREAKEFIDKMNFKLPPFVYFTPEEWAEKNHEYDEIRDNMLGWDVTDFGAGNFDKLGLTLVTIRNGNEKIAKYTKPYAEKLLIVKEDQITPYHFHWAKMEDIINRGGGNLMIQVYNATDDDKFDLENPVTLHIDGREYQVAPGSIIRLTPGESISIQQRMYHKFWGEPGHGTVLVGEVSKVNDDTADNRFYEPAGRFPSIEEDEAPLYLLCNEYPAAK